MKRLSVALAVDEIAPPCHPYARYCTNFILHQKEISRVIKLIVHEKWSRRTVLLSLMGVDSIYISMNLHRKEDIPVELMAKV